MICELCNKELTNYKSLSIHLRYKHKITSQQYYDQFLLKDNTDMCKECGKKCNFVNLSKGYHQFCCRSCKSKSSSRNNVCIFGTEEGKTKIRETLLKKYGVDHSSKIPGISEKRNNTHIKNTGYDLWHDPNILNNKKKIDRKEVLKRYEEKTGYKNPNLNPDVRAKMSKKYRYKDILFDSSWEVAYYIWLVDNCKTFSFHDIEPIEYEYNGKKFNYLADFKTDTGLVEIKGSHLLSWMKQENTKSNAKYKCMLEHNVTIISDKEIKPILEYIQTKYGKDYLKQFRYEK